TSLSSMFSPSTSLSSVFSPSTSLSSVTASVLSSSPSTSLSSVFSPSTSLSSVSSLSSSLSSVSSVLSSSPSTSLSSVFHPLPHFPLFLRCPPFRLFLLFFLLVSRFQARLLPTTDQCQKGIPVHSQSPKKKKKNPFGASSKKALYHSVRTV